MIGDMIMNGWEYERLCAQYLECVGYTNVHVTTESGDQGVDVVGVKNGERIGFQCKLWNKPVTNKAVQEVYAGLNLYGCHKGAVITNNTFSKSAIELARANDILLLDHRTPEIMVEVIKECGKKPCIDKVSASSSPSTSKEKASTKSDDQANDGVKIGCSIVLVILIAVIAIPAIVISRIYKTDEQEKYAKIQEQGKAEQAYNNTTPEDILYGDHPNLLDETELLTVKYPYLYADDSEHATKYMAGELIVYFDDPVKHRVDGIGIQLDQMGGVISLSEAVDLSKSFLIGVESYYDIVDTYGVQYKENPESREKEYRIKYERRDSIEGMPLSIYILIHTENDDPRTIRYISIKTDLSSQNTNLSVQGREKFDWTP